MIDTANNVTSTIPTTQNTVLSLLLNEYESSNTISVNLRWYEGSEHARESSNHTKTDSTPESRKDEQVISTNPMRTGMQQQKYGEYIK